MAVDDSGRSFAAGLGNGDMRFGSFDIDAGGAQDVLFVVHDAEGQVLEAQSFDGAGSNAQGQAIGINSRGDAVIGGLYGDTLDVGGTVLSGNGSDNGFAFALADGSPRWASSFVSPDSVAVLATSIEQQGRACLGGQFEGPIDLGDGITRDTIDSNQAGDGFVVQYEADGLFASTLVIGSSAADRVFATVAMEDGCIFGGRVCGPSASVSQHLGNCDAYAARVSFDGTLEWLIPMGGTGSDRVSALEVATDGRVYVFGVYGAEMALGDFTLDANTGNGAFAAVLEADGTPLSLIGLRAQDLEIEAAAISSDGEFAVVAGDFVGTLDHALVSAESTGTRNAFLARVNF